MPRKASQGSKRTIVQLEFVLFNLMTRDEIQEVLDKDLQDPKSDLYRALAARLGWKHYEDELHRVYFRNSTCASWRGLPPPGKEHDPEWWASQELDDDADDDDDDYDPEEE